MKPFRAWVAAWLLLAGLPSQAAELTVLTAGAFKPVLVAMQPGFEARTGHRLRIANDTAGALQRRIAGGEAFDVVVSSPASLQALMGRQVAPSPPPVPVARVAIGVAVLPGRPVPDISSVAAFQRTLLTTPRIALIDPASGGSSGIYLAQLFERWGLAEQLRPRSVLVQGGLVAQKLVDGSADLAIHQISEILAVPGVQLVGPLPAEIQNHTTYAAAVSAASAHVQAAHALVQALQAGDMEKILQSKGMEPAP